jgi:hypothetical protein
LTSDTRGYSSSASRDTPRTTPPGRFHPSIPHPVFASSRAARESQRLPALRSNTPAPHSSRTYARRPLISPAQHTLPAACTSHLRLASLSPPQSIDSIRRSQHSRPGPGLIHAPRLAFAKYLRPVSRRHAHRRPKETRSTLPTRLLPLRAWRVPFLPRLILTQAWSAAYVPHVLTPFADPPASELAI